MVSRAPLTKLQKYQASKGWTIPWYSSHDSDFNYDFQATVASEEVPGLSCFLRDGSDIFHTYSTYARGTDILGSAYSMLDLTALGRQEDWEEPKGRSPRLHGPDPTFSD
jgi:predicted dithiol-disulfide oxidoreductase (DUF899 family)